MLKISDELFRNTGQVVANAFHNDPLWESFLPDPERRKIIAPKLSEIVLKVANKIGTVQITSEELEGVTMWFPKKTANSNMLHMIKAGQFLNMLKLSLKYNEEINSMQKYTSTLTKHRKILMKDRDYLYLAMICVAPEHQGKGFGRSLLNHLFSESKELNLPIYLETETTDNVSLYEHCGFKTIHETNLFDGKVHMWQMLRGPQQR